MQWTLASFPVLCQPPTQPSFWGSQKKRATSEIFIGAAKYIRFRLQIQSLIQSFILKNATLTPQPGMISTLFIEGSRLDFSLQLFSHTLYFFRHPTILRIHRPSTYSYESRGRSCKTFCIYLTRRQILQHS